jgi:hypothetical protein
MFSRFCAPRDSGVRKIKKKNHPNKNCNVEITGRAAYTSFAALRSSSFDVSQLCIFLLCCCTNETSSSSFSLLIIKLHLLQSISLVTIIHLPKRSDLILPANSEPALLHSSSSSSPGILFTHKSFTISTPQNVNILFISCVASKLHP